ncbi:MAG: hypothetical protein HY094_07165 [Candidatus Melainabacteria bacterium]|nr:hypothetical protein [Candidatus Melainabacteria bacterium]
MHTRPIDIQKDIPTLNRREPTGSRYIHHPSKSTNVTPILKPTSNIFIRTLKHFFSKPKSKTDTITRLLRACVIGFATVATTPVYIGINELLGAIGFIPQTSLEKSPDHKALTSETLAPLTVSPIKDHSEVKIDNFVKNWKDYAVILEILSKAGIKDLKSLDADGNGIALDSTKDFENTIAKLKEIQNSTEESSEKQFYERAITLLTEIKDLNKLIWGDNKPDLSNLAEFFDGECTLIAEAIGAALTEQNVQMLLKANLKVTNYDLSKKEPKTDLEVRINGKTIKLSDSDLRAYGPAHYDKGSTRGVTAFIYALGKELIDNYVVGDSWLSAPSTLLTGEKYYTMPVSIFSKASLEKIFTEAPPGSIIKLATYPTLEEYKSSNPRKSLNDFHISRNSLLSKHTYVTKGTKHENGKLKIIIKDSLKEHKLSIDQIKEDMILISVPASTVTFLNKQTLVVWLLALSMSVGITFAGKQIEKSHSQKKYFTS